MKIALLGPAALFAVSLALGSPGSAYAADGTAPAKKEEKKPGKAPPTQDKKKDGNTGSNTSDAYKLRGNTGT